MKQLWYTVSATLVPDGATLVPDEATLTHEEATLVCDEATRVSEVATEAIDDNNKYIFHLVAAYTYKCPS